MVQACAVCHPTLPSLSAAASHYVIPDGRALDDYLELFEVPEVSNVLLLTSAVRPVRSASSRAAVVSKWGLAGGCGGMMEGGSGVAAFQDLKIDLGTRLTCS